MLRTGRTGIAAKAMPTLPARAEASSTAPKGRRIAASAKSNGARIVAGLKEVAGQGRGADKAMSPVPASAEARLEVPKGQPLGASATTSKVSKGQSEPARKRHKIDAQGDAAEEARICMPQGQIGFASSVDTIKHLGSHRRFLIKQKIRVTNGVGGKVRSALGWRPDLSKDESAKIIRRAAKLIRAVEHNELDSLPEGDRGVAYGVGTLIFVGVKMREPAEKALADVEEAMELLARDTPGYAFQQSVRGFGEKGLAIIIAEAGDLSLYPKKGHLWKRLGLAVIGDERQRCYSDVELAELHGYNPRRRAEMWTLGDSLLRAQLRKGEDDEPSQPLGPYGEAYLHYRASALEKTRVTTAGETEPWTKNHAHKHAARCMFKRLIRDLWKAWRAN